MFAVTMDDEALAGAFLSACRGAGSTESQCLCFLEGVENEYTQSEFLTIEQEMVQTGQMPPFFTGIQARC